MLGNRFAEFFCQKIEAIRNDSFARYTPVANSLGDAQACSAKLSEFERMTEDQVKSLVNSSRLKTCSLDPLPASIMKDCMVVLLPVLTKMINISIDTTTVPVQLKEAIISTAWNEQFRGIYGTVIFHDTRRILDGNVTCQETWRVIGCRVPDTSFAACQDKSRSGYVKCSVSREIRALILNGTDLLSEWAKLLHFDAHFFRTRTGS